MLNNVVSMRLWPIVIISVLQIVAKSHSSRLAKLDHLRTSRTLQQLVAGNDTSIGNGTDAGTALVSDVRGH
jgi:hypothetical protein